MQRRLVALLAAMTILVAGAVMWVVQDRPQLPPAPAKRVAGAHDALTQMQAARHHGVEAVDPGAFFRGFLFAKNMVSVKAGSPSVRWRPMGPVNWGGRTLALAIDPRAPQTMYAGSASGGLWKSDSGGQGENAWRLVDTGYPVLGVASIALDPSDPDTILIGTGEVYSYQTGIPSVVERIMRGSFGIGILKSTDGGDTWRMSLDWRYDQRTGVQAIEFDPHDSNVVWAATTEGVYLSVDRGETWELSLNVVMATDIIIHRDDPDRLIVACGGMRSPGYGLYRTLDGGNSWARVFRGLPGDFGGKAMLGASASHPDTVYATFGPHPYDRRPPATSYLARSDSFGSSWRIVSDTDFARFQGFYSHFVAVHPDNPYSILVGGVEMWHSADGGGTLEQMDLLVTDNQIIDTMVLVDGPWVTNWGDNHAMAFHPTDPDIYYIACDQGIFRTGNGGASFERSVGGYQTTQFYDGMAQSQNHRDRLYGSIQDWCGIAYSGSDSWYLYDLLFEGGRMEIDPTDEEITYSSYYYLDWMLRHDHGDIVDITPPTGSSASFSAPFVLSPSNPRVLYAGRDVVYRSTDRGQSWDAPGSGLPLNPDPYNPTLSMAISHQDENRVYAATAPYETISPEDHRARVFSTVNGGATWLEITGPLPDRFVMDILVHPSDDEQVFLALSGFGSSHVWATRDGGLTWEDLDRGELPDVPTSALALDPGDPERIFVGNDLGVFVSPDRGGSWFSLNAGLPSAVMVFDLEVFAPERLLRAGTHGNGVWEIVLPDRLAANPAPPRRAGGRRP